MPKSLRAFATPVGGVNCVIDKKHSRVVALKNSALKRSTSIQNVKHATGIETLVSLKLGKHSAV